MRLAMITTYATPGNMRRELLEAVRNAGHDVTVIAPEPDEVMREPLASFGASYRRWEVNRTSIDPLGDLAAAWRLYSILQSVRPDVVLLYQIKTVLLAPSMARLARVPRIVALINGLGAAFDDRGFGLTWKARLARHLYGVSLRQTDEIVFQNHDDPALLRSGRFLSARASWRVVPGSGVDLVRFQPVKTTIAVPTFTLVSRLLVSKGVRDFAGAARKLRERGRDVKFRLVGQLEATDHPDAITRSEIDEWVASNLLEYTGFTSDVRSVLASTTVFVLPSYYREGVPRTNLEALAMGLPIVTADSVGCRETVVDGENGFLVPPRAPEILAERLARYLDDPTLAERHGRASRALAENKFDLAKVNQLMLEALALRA